MDVSVPELEAGVWHGSTRHSLRQPATSSQMLLRFSEGNLTTFYAVNLLSDSGQLQAVEVTKCFPTSCLLWSTPDKHILGQLFTIQQAATAPGCPLQFPGGYSRGRKLFATQREVTQADYIAWSAERMILQLPLRLENLLGDNVLMLL